MLSFGNLSTRGTAHNSSAGGGYFGVNQFSLSLGRGYYFFLQNPPFLDILVIRHIFKKGALSTQQSKVVCIVKFITSAINQGGALSICQQKVLQTFRLIFDSHLIFTFVVYVSF